jgi:ADP-ribosyl-[dinitrogen reductase] hydrolase
MEDRTGRAYHPPASTTPLQIMDRDRALGALLGAAVGDALGMPVAGLSHQNVRLYYKGIKGYTDDEKRGDLRAGQWTAYTQRQSALTRFLTSCASSDTPEAKHTRPFFWPQVLREPHLKNPPIWRGLQRTEPPLRALGLRRASTLAAPSAELAAAIAPLGVWAAARGVGDKVLSEAAHAIFDSGDVHPLGLAVASGQARAVALALTASPRGGGGVWFLEDVAVAVRVAEVMNEVEAGVSEQLLALSPHLDETPLDLQDRCNGTGLAADEAFPFAVAMFARNPALVEATLLSAVNVGGAASAVGAMTGALLGAFNGWSAFPQEWREGLEDVARLEAEAAALLDALG